MSERDLTPIEERSVIALAFDEPDFFSFIINKLSNEYFNLYECKFLFTIIKFQYDSKSTIPTRELTRDLAMSHLTVDDPYYREVLEVCDYKIDPRNYTTIKENFINWLKDKAYGVVFSDEGINAFKNGDYERISEIVDNASRIQDIGQGGLWFFNQIDTLFDETVETKYTTGFDRLDSYLNEGGPTAGDVLLWMAPTGVGKSLAIINNAAACIRRGLDVLHVTLELSEWKTALRYCGVFSKYPIKTRLENKEQIKNILSKTFNTYKAHLAIYEYPPDDISIDTILALVDHLDKTKRWRPKVIALDYIELLLSRNPYYNRDEYLKQKRIATEVRQLAKKTGCYVISATQTNREDNQNGKKESVIDLNRVAESYGKTMPVDYVVSINQTRSEYISMPGNKSKLRFYIAKNRNGPKFEQITVNVNYQTMEMVGVENEE